MLYVENLELKADERLSRANGTESDKKRGTIRKLNSFNKKGMPEEELK